MSDVRRLSWGQCRFRLTRGVTIKWAELGLVVFVPITGEYWFGNATGGEVLEELSDGLVPAAISDRLVSNYGISVEQASSDVSAIVDELLKHSVIELET